MCLPFLAGLGFLALIHEQDFWGPSATMLSFVLVFATAIAITSIPVITRIMYDLGILDTAFARIVLGVAVIEDVALYVVLAVALGIATGTGNAFGLPAALGLEPGSVADIAYHVVVTVATRMPAMIVGAASGSWTWRSNWLSVIPIATADSHTAASTPRIPTKVLRRRGSSAYSTSATIAVRLPMPPMNGIGIRKPSNARLGTVCMIFANPSSHGRAFGRRVRKIPSGTPMAMATTIAFTTSNR
jgi:hypothetical protein